MPFLPSPESSLPLIPSLAVVGRVLQKPHQLEGVSLDVSPHYDFLEPLEEEEEEEEKEATIAATAAVEEGALPADGGIPLTGLPLPEAALRQLLQSSRALQELAAPVPEECSLHLEGARLCVTGGDPARRRQLQEHVRATLEAAVQERLPFSAWVLGFLQREDVRGRLAELLAERQVVAGCLPRAEEVLVVALAPSSARLAASLLGSLLGSFALALSERHLLALGSPRWAQVEASLRCCQVRLAESGDQLEGLTLAGLEEENLARLEAFLQDSAPDEALVAAEPAPLRYLQRYHQDLLASISDVALLPLEEPDVTGLRALGATEAQACRAAAELLQSLLGAIHTETVVLQLPGIQRFLLEDRGQAIVRDLERRFQCILGLEHLHWHPPETQHELEWSQEPLALGCQRENRHGSGPPGGVAQDQSEASLEEIKDLLAALQPNLVDLPAADGDWWPLVSSKGEEEEDLYTDPGQAPAGAPPAEEEEEEEEEAGSLVLEVPEEEASPQGAGSLLGPKGSVEEEAQLLLAIQESMDSVRREEEELRQATELSRCSWEKEQQRGPSPDGALWSALSMSLQELEAARVVACVGSKEQAAPLARELEATLRAQLREEKVANRALSSLPALCQDYLAYLERKHAVRILLAGTVATVQGFADYPVAATRDLALLLTRLLQAEGPACPGSTRWVRWEPSGDGSPTPYPAETSALLEQAWHRGLKRVDVFFGGRPFIIDLERMEEHDLGNAQTLPIGRIEPPPPAAPSAPPALAEDKGQLVPLSEASEEFRQTVRHFYDTLRGLHNKIHIVKVEKLVHPLLHQQYQLKKAAMEKACGHQQVERLLYHGTTEESSREICQHGFNRSFCGRNATHYGHGVYFAASAFLSAQEKYSPASSSSGNKYIFVAQTLVGDYTTGSQSMRAPPLREGDAVPRRYDSTVDNPRDPSIFVIFNDTQAYPQYLITCRWSNLR
nr:poly [ADP-ribose] polymerase 10 [Pogona vitticeps]